MMVTTSTLRCEVMLGKMLTKPGDVNLEAESVIKRYKRGEKGRSGGEEDMEYEEQSRKACHCK